MFKQPLFRKLVTIAIVALLLLIPLSMIEGKISERQYRQTQVEDEIAQTSAGNQTLAGPYIVLHYKLRKKLGNNNDDGKMEYGETGYSTYYHVITPNRMLIDSKAAVSTRNRGIYKARLFNANSVIKGDFIIPQNFGIENSAEEVVPIRAYLVMSMTDARGIRNTPALNFNHQTFTFQQGAIKPLQGSGIHAALSLNVLSQASTLPFQFALDIEGSKTLAVAPVAEDTQMRLTTNWPHPSFNGQFKPKTYTISKQGFSAHWQVPKIALNAQLNGDTTRMTNEVFSVDFIEPVNVYLLSERAIKYGLLFVLLVFTGFFLFEISKSLAIHPMQYLLVGLAMAMFFLLMISLSEHIAFIWAYSIAGLACVSLIALYLSAVLKSRANALGFSGGLGLMYALLYMVLQSEDNALLMGTCVMFSALAAVMLLTRKLDWYQLKNNI